MERKKFLKASLCLSAFGGVRQVLGEEPKAATPPNRCEGVAEFGRRLLTRFMSDMDEQLDEPRRAALMEARGRSCARLTGKPVKVEVLETLKRGGQVCRFNVILAA